MTAAANLQSLPVWVWLLFVILLVGFITLIYSQGNWRTTLSVLMVTIGISLAGAGIYFWDFYLATHFIGQFDALGIPFRKAGPGWSILLEAWPLWLVPAGLIAMLVMALNWSLARFFPSKTVVTGVAEPKEQITPTEVFTPLQNVTKKLELETLRRDLAATKEKLLITIEMAETQIDKNQNLEIKLAQSKNQQQEKIAELQDRITALTLQIESLETQNTELTSRNLQQAEEVLRLQANTSAISSSREEPQNLG